MLLSVLWRGLVALVILSAAALPARAELPAQAVARMAQDDYTSFVRTGDRMAAYDMIETALMAELKTGDVLDALTTEQRPRFMAALRQGLRDRRDAIMARIYQDMFQSFSHRDIVRLSQLSAQDYMRDTMQAAVAALAGDKAPLEAIMARQAPEGFTDADSVLMERYLEALVGAADLIAPDLRALTPPAAAIARTP